MKFIRLEFPCYCDEIIPGIYSTTPAIGILFMYARGRVEASIRARAPWKIRLKVSYLKLLSIGLLMRFRLNDEPFCTVHSSLENICKENIVYS